MRVSPTTKQILKIAGVGAILTGSLVAPGLVKLLKNNHINYETFFEEDEWDIFDKSRLKQKLKVLHKQKVINIFLSGEKVCIQVTQKGRRRMLSYNLDEMKIVKPKSWDKKWRLIAYDIPKEKKKASDVMRFTLRNLGLLQLQKSLYLYPYPCSEIIEFLREYYDIAENVTYLTIGFLENEQVYKEYFGV